MKQSLRESILPLCGVTKKVKKKPVDINWPNKNCEFRFKSDRLKLKGKPSNKELHLIH
jgi:hypothetical protein